MARFGPITIGKPDDRITKLQETLERSEAQSSASISMFKERLAELELALDEVGWDRISSGNSREFSRDALMKIIAMSRLMFLKNPLINRAVTLQAAYVWGQGVNIQAKDDQVNEVVQAFLDDPANLVEFSGHQARMMKEVDLQTLGNIFFVFFTDPKGAVKVRTIPVDEITDIICNPDDAKEPWFYRRKWQATVLDEGRASMQTQEREAYYADWRYNPPFQTSTFNGEEVIWDSPVYHLKAGGMSDMRFGVPETYAAMDWARAYKDFLEDWSTIVRALSRFAWKLTAPGGSSAVAAAKTKLNSTFALGGNAETNPPPLAGSTFISGGGADLQPIKTSGATVAAEDGRRLLLMVAAATGLPETFFGDAAVGTLATAKSLDRPTELKFRARQTLWADVLTDMIEYAIEKKMGAPMGLPQTLTDEQWALDINFPSVLEHDVTESVGAIVDAATLKGNPAVGTIPMELLIKLLLNALGVDDVDEIIADMDEMPQLPTPDGQTPEEQQQAQERYFRAMDDLKHMIQEARKA